MTRRFHISFEVTVAQLPTIVSLLTSEVQDFKIAEVNGPNNPRLPKFRRFKVKPEGHPNWVHQYAQTITDFFKNAKPDSEFHYKKIGEAVHKKHPHVAILSVTPILSALTKDGVVYRTGKGYYKLAPATKGATT